MQNGLVLGRRAETQGLGVGGQGTLVIAAFEQLVALLPQLLGRAGLWREKGGGQSRAAGRGAGSGDSPVEG